MTHPVLELQAALTMADQLRHRRERMAERDQLLAARNALVRWDRSRALLRKRLDELTAAIEQAEADSQALDRDRARLQAQLKTVIAPREAEALQHELADIERRRGELDDAELEALEEQVRVDSDLSTLLGDEPSLREAYLAADAAVSAAEADIDSELERIDARLDDLRTRVDAKVLARFDQLRQHHVVAAAPLVGSRCDGCHIDLSAHEIDEVRAAAAAGGVAECPQCGRILIV